METIKIKELATLADLDDEDYLVVDTLLGTFKITKHAFAQFIKPSEIGLGNVFDLKGSKETKEVLPETGNKIGDVWYVEDESVGYVWIKDIEEVERWEQLGLPIDLSNYVTNTALATTLLDYVTNTALANKVDKVTGKGLSTEDFTSALKTKLEGIATGATANTGTVTKVSTGVGLTGGDITTTGTVKAKLKSETAHTADSATPTNTASRQYAVGVDKSGYLSVNVPWTDNNTNTTYTFAGGTNKFTVTPSGGTAQDVAVTPSIAVATTSANGLMSSTDKTKLDGIATGATKVTVDRALSSSSTNPVQNKVINYALANKVNTSDLSAITNTEIDTIVAS